MAVEALAMDWILPVTLHDAGRRAVGKLDGILRNHRLGPEGTLRDTCCYSIISSEWPTVKVHLAHLAQHDRSRTSGGCAS